jgi:biopolymer transport protein ExbD
MVFVLLVIFMITTPLMEQKMDVNLPESRPTESQQVDPSKVRQVAVDQLGRVFLDRQEMTVEELEQRLKVIHRDEPDAAVALRADKNLKYQQLIYVLDAIRASGLKLGLSTVPEK